MDEIAWSELKHNYGDGSDVPGLLRGCLDPDRDTAGGAVDELVGLLAREAHTAQPRIVDPGWWPALEAVRHRLLPLLDDPDPAARSQAVLTLSEGVRHPDSAAALRRRWAVEAERAIRCDLVLAFGAVLDSPDRVGTVSGWRTFAVDREAVEAASRIVA